MTLKPSDRYSNDIQKRVLIGMITSKLILAQISLKWTKEGLFSEKYSNLIGTWCVDFYRKYKEAPKKAIEGLLLKWSRKNQDEALLTSIEKLITQVHDLYEAYEEDLNVELTISEANTHFNEVRQTKLFTEFEALREAKATHLEIDELLDKWTKRVNIGGEDSGIDLFNDPDSIREAFDEKTQECLVPYKGHDNGIKKFLGDSLSRGNFVTLLGPEKRGKTWILMDMALRAVEGRKKVAFFEIGDLSKNQTIRRFAAMVAKKAMKPCEYRVPLAIEDQGGVVSITKYKEVNQTKPLDWQYAIKAFDEMKTHKIKSKKTYFQLVCCPAGTMSVDGIYSWLDRWEQDYDGWKPDVVVIDYADLMVNTNKFTEQRDSINEIWLRLRGLSLHLNGLVLTATQANRSSYKAGIIKMDHISEEKRKLSHVTGAIGLNQTSDEKRENIIRWNWVVLREEDYVPNNCVHVAQCLRSGRPVVRSIMPAYRPESVESKEA